LKNAYILSWLYFVILGLLNPVYGYGILFAVFVVLPTVIRDFQNKSNMSTNKKVALGGTQMKIMYVIDAGPVNGGAPISTSILANQFAGDDNEVIMVMPKNKDTEILDKRIKRIELARFSDYFPLDVFIQ